MNLLWPTSEGHLHWLPSFCYTQLRCQGRSGLLEYHLGVFSVFSFKFLLQSHSLNVPRYFSNHYWLLVSLREVVIEYTIESLPLPL